jgi:hypothetical protein
MSDYRQVLERIGDQVPMPEPALDRIVRRRQRKERRERLAAAALGVGIALVMVFAVVSAMDRATPEPATTPSVTTFTDEGPADLLPALGSEPTRGGVGRLLFWYRSGANDTSQYLFLYEDGRLITNPGPYDGNLDTRWAERRLTSEGVALLTDTVAAVDLPASDNIVVQGSQGWHQFSTVPGWERLVEWGSRSWTSAPDSVADPADAAAFVRLGERLDDPSGWLPRSAWERAQPRPYVAASYLVTVERLDEGPASDAWRARQRDLGDLPFPTGVQPPAVGGCASVDLETARNLASALDAAGVRFNWDAYIGLDQDPGYGMEWPALSDGRPVIVRIVLPLPHEDCEDRPDH